MEKPHPEEREHARVLARLEGWATSNDLQSSAHERIGHGEDRYFRDPP